MRAEEEGVRFRVAGFWRRAAAAALDALLLVPLVALFGAITASVGGAPLPRLGELGLGYVVSLALDGGAAGPAALAMGAIVVALYSFVFVAARGQTPGKQLLGLEVIDAWGERPSMTRALARTAAYFPSLLMFSLGFLWIGFDREKRGLHDWLAGTWVVVRRAAPAPRPVEATP
jgi:uncharacterized RDD family membrane protein YckC